MEMQNRFVVRVISFTGFLISLAIIFLHLLKVIAIDYVVLTCGYSMLILFLILTMNPVITSAEISRAKKHSVLIWSLAILLMLFLLAGAIHAYLNISETPKEIPVELIIFLITACLGVLLILNVDFSELNIFGIGIKVRKDLKAIMQRQIRNQVITVSGTNEYFWIDDSGIQHWADKLTAFFLSQEKGIIAVSKDDKFEAGRPLPSFLKTADVRYNDPDLFILYNGTIYYQKTWSFVYRIAAEKIDVTNKDLWAEWKKNLDPLKNEDLDNDKLGLR